MSAPNKYKMKKSMCCNADMIYLGKNNIHAPITKIIGDTYNYCCYKCGNCKRFRRSNVNHISLFMYGL